MNFKVLKISFLIMMIHLNVSANPFGCVRENLVADISLNGRQTFNWTPLSIKDAFRAMCTQTRISYEVFSAGKYRIQSQLDELDRLIRFGQISYEESNYLEGKLYDLKYNIEECRREAADMRRFGNLPPRGRRVAIGLRPDGLLDVFLHDDFGNVWNRMSILPHFYGELLLRERYRLCSTHFLN